MESKEDLAINRVSECGLLIDHYFEVYDKLVARGFERGPSLAATERLINSFICYKAGLVIEQDVQEQCPMIVLEDE